MMMVYSKTVDIKGLPSGRLYAFTEFLIAYESGHLLFQVATKYHW